MFEKLAHLSTSGRLPKDQIVISGISGRFPEANNMDELRDNLFNHVDMVTCDGRRWPPGMIFFLLICYSDTTASRGFPVFFGCLWFYFLVFLQIINALEVYLSGLPVK